MHTRSGLRFTSTALLLGLIMLLPSAALGDGYAPLNLPDRGAGPSGVQGESTTSATPSPTPTATVTPDEAADVRSGTVQRVDDGRLVVEVDGVERTVDLPNDVLVTRDGQESSLSEIESGDTASFERNDEGEVTEVRVASAQSMNFWRGFLPILVVVLIGFYLLSRRSKRSSA